MAVHPLARFSDPAELYDLLYTFKDYAAEAAALRAHLHELGVPDGARLLEGACGTGAYLRHLAPHFRVAGFDLDPRMIAVARRNVPGGDLFVADLVDFTVAEPVDAAFAVFGGLAYVFPEARLARACAALFAAVRPGGVALVEPWLGPAEVTPNSVQMAVIDLPHLKVARQVVPTVRERVLELDFHYLVARPGLGVELIRDRNALRLYEVDELAGALRGAGFEVQLTDRGFMPEKRLLVCKRL